MKGLLICADGRTGTRLLGENTPSSCVPLLGQSLIEYWMAHLAASGMTEVTILASEPCVEVRTIVGNGARWGLNANVLVKPPQLGPIENLLQQESLEPAPGTLPETSIAVLDHFPGAPEFPLFESYAALFQGLMAWMPRACTPDRVDAREIEPGVFVGTHSVIHPRAELRGPCWIGSRAHVGANCIIGPEAVIEQGAFIDARAEVARSIVRPNTFVGRFAVLNDCLAAGGALVDFASGVETQVPDPFVLSALRPLRPLDIAGSLASRLADLYSRHKSDVLWAWKHLALRKEG